MIYFILGFLIGDIIDQLVFRKGVFARIIDTIDCYFAYKKAKNRLERELLKEKQ